jgi:GPI mannosyltransferase 3
MDTALKNSLSSNRKLQLLLLFMLIVQVITAINQPGFFHPDQHFQIVEFSSYQLNRPSAAPVVWELKAAVRPTLQVYIYSGYTVTLDALGITDPYTKLTILRVLLSLLMFFVFTAMAFYYARNEQPVVLYSVLFILNLSFFFPYIKTLFSSEILSALVFFGTLFLYHYRQQKPKDFLFLALAGFLFSIAFYLRFQVGFAILGFGLWLVFVEKRYDKILPLAIGFIIGTGLNTWLDYMFYHQLVLTPYQYYHVNITEGKAATFGTSSFIQYILVLIGFITTPPLSIILFILLIIAAVRHYRHPFVLPVVLFFIGHCMVSHKEERFLFTIFPVLPIMIGLAIPSFLSFYRKSRKSLRYTLVGIIIVSVAVNLFLLLLMMFNPFAQTVYFAMLLEKKFVNQPTTFYCLQRTPFQTESGLPQVYYQQTAPYLDLRKIPVNSLRVLNPSPQYVITTYNQVRKDKQIMDSLHYKPILFSSPTLWKINEVLDTKGINTINDIWALYQKE